MATFATRSGRNPPAGQELDQATQMQPQRSVIGVVRIMAIGLLLAMSLTVSGQEDTTGLVPPADTTAAENPTTPIYTITADDLDSELGSQDISGILQSSRDLFTSTAAFNWGSARFRIR
ncbi:MAG: hypothetical protein KDB88_09855, partial [Flavobacteriales bacterium]|nr:hypothetical protein [Flavobacteriales bacterium]